MIGPLYEMKSGVLLLTMLSAAMELHGESGKGHSLACYKCYSDTSWEDCDKEMYAVNCSVGYDEVCTKLVRTWWDDTKSGSEQQMTSYARGCDLAEACADKECKEKGWECTIECCSTNLCNTSITILPNFLLIEVFLYLALEAIAIF